MAGYLVKPLLSLFRTEWRERGYGLWAAIQRRGHIGSILAWTVILSVYGTDTIAIDLSLSARIS